MKDSRYKFQPRYIKTARWLRYRPLSLLQFAYYCLHWAAHGCQSIDWSDDYKEERLQVIGTFWNICKSNAEYKMQNYLTMDECFQYLRDGRDRVGTTERT